MSLFRADLHIHTCLSPCGSLEMSPSVIVNTALARGLDVIAITDHNSTLQCAEIQGLGKEKGLTVFAGAEVTTGEEAHCVALFGTDQARDEFQTYLNEHLPPIPNNPGYFGDQVWVNRKDEILGEVPYLLLSALDQSVDRIARKVRELEGLFVAAHVERPSFSLISQLGFIDPALPLDAVEYNHPERYANLVSIHPYLRNYTQYTASDAHYPEQIGSRYAVWKTEKPTFENLRKAYRKEEGFSLFVS